MANDSTCPKCGGTITVAGRLTDGSLHCFVCGWGSPPREEAKSAGAEDAPLDLDAIEAKQGRAITAVRGARYRCPIVDEVVIELGPALVAEVRRLSKGLAALQHERAFWVTTARDGLRALGIDPDAPEGT